MYRLPLHRGPGLVEPMYPLIQNPSSKHTMVATLDNHPFAGKRTYFVAPKGRPPLVGAEVHWPQWTLHWIYPQGFEISGWDLLTNERSA